MDVNIENAKAAWAEYRQAQRNTVNAYMALAEARDTARYVDGASTVVQEMAQMSAKTAERAARIRLEQLYGDRTGDGLAILQLHLQAERTVNSTLRAEVDREGILALTQRALDALTGGVRVS